MPKAPCTIVSQRHCHLYPGADGPVGSVYSGSQPQLPSLWTEHDCVRFSASVWLGRVLPTQLGRGHLLDVPVKVAQPQKVAWKLSACAWQAESNTRAPCEYVGSSVIMPSIFCPRTQCSCFPPLTIHMGPSGMSASGSPRALAHMG